MIKDWICKNYILQGDLQNIRHSPRARDEKKIECPPRLRVDWLVPGRRSNVAFLKGAIGWCQ